MQITEDNHRNDRFQPAECQKPKAYIITVLWSLALCEGNLLVTGEFLSQIASNMEILSP